jgi:beta-lactamase class D
VRRAGIDTVDATIVTMRLSLLLALLPAVAGLLQAPATPDLSPYFGDLDGTFVLLDGRTGSYVRHDPTRAAQRFAPCSTFKIPHTAILLESGAAPDPGYTLAYDPALEQPKQWARDFDLTGAFKASALWYYRAMARRAGMPAEARWVEQFQYGNRNTSGGLDGQSGPFWVDGTLRISADEQVDFLRRFHDEKLGLSARTTKLTKAIMVVEDSPTGRLSAKTGACRPSGEPTTNWYVGYVEKADTVYYFALQIGANEYGRAYSERVTISRRILAALGVLEGGTP